jgi:phosphatidylcholine synthase
MSGRNRAVSDATLDPVVDFLAYVLVPVVALARSDLMPATASLWLGLLVVVASALYFADKRMKTADHWFRGFPAVWNVLAVLSLRLAPALADRRGRRGLRPRRGGRRGNYALELADGPC